MILLRISGIICLLFTVFHLLFPLMPDWKPTLSDMPEDMKYIFITYHYILIALLGGMGLIVTFQTVKLIKSPIKNSALMLFSSLFIIRIITEVTLWKLPFPQALIIIPLCLFPVVGFFSSIFSPETTK